ncbi:retrotransposon protein, putative, ty3-gypsy subclass [Tanacetum coccineum]
MTWHATRKCTKPDKMQHPVDGRAWKKFDTRYLDFAAEPRNAVLIDDLRGFIGKARCQRTIDVANSGQGYMACPTCNEDTPSERVLSKTAYVGHKRFIKKPHKWRRSLDFNSETEDGDPPREFYRDAIR